MKRIYINHNEKCSTNKNIERSIWKHRYKKKPKAFFFTKKPFTSVQTSSDAFDVFAVRQQNL